MENSCRKYKHQKLVLNQFLIFVNNPKQPQYARNLNRRYFEKLMTSAYNIIPAYFLLSTYFK